MLGLTLSDRSAVERPCMRDTLYNRRTGQDRRCLDSQVKTDSINTRWNRIERKRKKIKHRVLAQ